MSIENWGRPELKSEIDSGKFIYKLVISYNGRNFFGWQSQANRNNSVNNDNSVQGNIERALYVITRQKLKLVGSGRTDSGVHALAQVASFEIDIKLDEKKLKKSLNGILPDTIRILDVKEQKKFFNARLSTYLRQYVYKIKNISCANAFDKGFVYFVNGDLDLSLLKEFAFILEGDNKDFYSFDFTKTKDSHSTKRDLLSAEVFKRDSCIFFRLTANAFLYHQVRAIIGEIVRLSLDKTLSNDEKIKNFSSLFEDKKQKVKVIAPPYGLYLEKIIYSKNEYLKILENFRRRHFLKAPGGN